MSKLIIVNQIAFGYHTDPYYYCKYLRDEYDIVYICWDHGLPRVEMSGVQVIYVNRKGNILVRTSRFLRQALSRIDDNASIVFMNYFKGVSLVLRLLRPRRCFVLDIRTCSVHKSRLVRWFHDARLKFESRFFRHVSIISKGLGKKLRVSETAHILPLGGEVVSPAGRTFEKLNFLYVGTLYNRNMDVTIHGFKQFYEEFKNRIPLSYTIIGSGPYNEEDNLKQLAAQCGLTGVVTVAGRIPHTHLKRWFDRANVGVSYVPLTDYYECQPVTKTFEYLLSGMPVIATGTLESRKVIDPRNGVLVGDSAENFSSGLRAIFDRRNLFNSEAIRNAAMGYTWESIVRKNLKVYLDEVCVRIGNSS